MKFKTIKKASDVTLEGIKVEFEMLDGSVKGLTLTDSKGSLLRVMERGYNICVEIPAPPETENKWKLSGTLLGLPVEKVYDNDWEAKEEQGRLERACREESDSSLKVEQIAIPVAT